MPKKMQSKPCNHLYGRIRWVRKSRRQLRDHPLCNMCLQDGLVVAATVADHIKPHQGNAWEFWNGKLQSLCKYCHDNRKSEIEQLGYETTIGEDGYPIDPKHPSRLMK